MGHDVDTDEITIKETYIDSKSVNERLLHLSMVTGYNCIQKNGQRFYGPPPTWTGPPPERGSEIFVGRLPRDCFEDEFVPVFENVAPLYEVRLMMNFTGYNRGFAFITYCNSFDAWNAVKILNNYEIRPGHKLGVTKSIDNCRLYIGGIPTTKNKNDAFEELIRFCPTVKDVIMYPDSKDRTKNRGFFFAEFDTHRTAAMAKRALIPGTVKLWGMEITVDWAVPEPDIDPKVMSSVTKLFIRNLSPNFTCERIHRILYSVMYPNAVQRVYICGHYGFIHFSNRESAEIAMHTLYNMTLDGESFEVSWARPKIYRKPNICNNYTNYCRSLPPRFRRSLEQVEKDYESENDIEAETSISQFRQESIPMNSQPIVQNATPQSILHAISPIPPSMQIPLQSGVPAASAVSTVHELNNIKRISMYTAVQYPCNMYMYPPNSLAYYHQ